MGLQEGKCLATLRAMWVVVDGDVRRAGDYDNLPAGKNSDTKVDAYLRTHELTLSPRSR